MKLLSYDSPFVQFMERVGDIFILSLLTLVCSLPVITAGAALTAHYKVTQDLVLYGSQPVLRSYFQSFAQNFKQATVFWLVGLAVMAFLVLDLFVIYVYFAEGWSQMAYMLVGTISAVVCGVLCCAFSLIARFENTVKEHLRNSIVLAIGQLPRTVLLVLLAALPVLTALMSLELFFNTLVFWLMFGSGLVIYVQCLIFKPVLLQLEPSLEEEDISEEGEAYTL